MDERLEALRQENEKLRQALDRSEKAREELLSQSQHLMDLLGGSLRELRELSGDRTRTGNHPI